MLNNNISRNHTLILYKFILSITSIVVGILGFIIWFGNTWAHGDSQTYMPLTKHLCGLLLPVFIIFNLYGVIKKYNIAAFIIIISYTVLCYYADYQYNLAYIVIIIIYLLIGSLMYFMNDHQ